MLCWPRYTNDVTANSHYRSHRTTFLQVIGMIIIVDAALIVTIVAERMIVALVMVTATHRAIAETAHVTAMMMIVAAVTTAAVIRPVRIGTALLATMIEIATSPSSLLSTANMVPARRHRLLLAKAICRP